MFTTADLPPDFQYDPNGDRAAIKASGLTVECRHGDPQCPRCVREAVKRLTEAQ